MADVHVPKPVNPMIPRTLFNEDHEAFRATARRFFETEIGPFHEKWEEQQHLDRHLWNKAGELGLLCMTIPEQYGGSGVDRLFSMIMMEEQARVGDSASGFPCTPILLPTTFSTSVTRHRSRSGCRRWPAAKPSPRLP